MRIQQITKVKRGQIHPEPATLSPLTNQIYETSIPDFASYWNYW
jgi:hypothetical protein